MTANELERDMHDYLTACTSLNIKASSVSDLCFSYYSIVDNPRRVAYITSTQLHLLPVDSSSTPLLSGTRRAGPTLCSIYIFLLSYYDL